MMDVLVCPLCGATFQRHAQALRCASGHSFDIARQGYVNLLPGGAAVGMGDTADMVRAREAFLGAGHYGQLATLLAERAAQLCTGGPIVEPGAGTGYYLGTVLGRIPDAIGLALDISKFAARKAARAHPRLAAAVTDVWHRWPVRDASAALILNVFAPRNGAEFRRVLRTGGAALVVAPTSRHLAEVIEPLRLLTVDQDKEERVETALAGHLDLEHSWAYDFDLKLTRHDLEWLVRMGPSARHVTEAQLQQRASALRFPLRVTASVTLAVYRAR